MREDPDVILVGELRDLETIRLAMTAAETGHLVFGTLHTTSAPKTIDRIIDVFPGEEKDMVRSMLSESLRAVISQTLLKKVGGGRVAAHEIMIGIPAIRNLIREDKIAQMYSSIQTGASHGMQTMDQCLASLVNFGIITTNDARAKAQDKTQFVLTELLKMSLPLNHFLQVMIDKKASDLFVSSQLPVSAKINGELVHLTDEKLSDESSLALVESAMSDKQRQEFHDTKECNFAIATDEGRFRVSAFWQRDRAGMVIRRIVTKIPDVNELGLPSTLTDVIMAKRGLVLFVGGTGTGKSTSLAALLGYRNRNQRGHILTIEDPIEFVHEHRKSIITQREVGLDTESFESALKSSLRQST